ncbi:HD domain-containing protein [Sporolactobacillus sp. CPB3-1]|uniref:HD domain-containing protein n=1 Tax=Sporolactobacillus mangiferae TaxID=2940498 RepID=A0ABT0MAE0_9BACL|nr:HD domain-containing protein [Sporolactobacillus mangiferae]MCL1631300.1 HD domain-containing protein [Sporolactobacillus mangiferae]
MTRSFQKLNEEKVFKDPVHRYIHVRDRLIWDLIGAPEFQRLRRIRQLGTTYLTFHGAEHSRFGHSLGVYEIARRVIDIFKYRNHWDDSETMITLCAALLHDVGHGPFSHSFEKVFGTNHEEYTQKIILGDTEIHRILEKQGSGFAQRVADVIGKTYPNRLVVSLISSQIDADRMDYLLRDAYFTGVSYGHFDMERIWRVMRTRDDQIVFKLSGMHAVEDYIMSRYQMYWQVYFHPVTRSAEVILTQILHRAKDLYQQGFRFKYLPHPLLKIFNGKITLHDYLKLDESVILYFFQVWQEEADPILSDLCYRFMNRRLFKYVEFTPALLDAKDRLSESFQAAGIDPKYYLEIDSSSNSPYDLYRPGEEGERQPIQLLMPDGTLHELSQESDVVGSITGMRRTDCKLYYPKDRILDLPKHSPHQKDIQRLLGI